MESHQSDRLMSDINVTPFVDVMLVLLIIFMVTAPMMIQGVDVSLPEVTSEPMISDKEHLLITIDKANNIYINELEVGLEFLAGKLERLLENRSDREVYLRADKNIPYGMVVHVMSQVKKAGVDKLGMVTIPPETEEKG